MLLSGTVHGGLIGADQLKRAKSAVSELGAIVTTTAPWPSFDIVSDGRMRPTFRHTLPTQTALARSRWARMLRRCASEEGLTQS